MTTQAAKFPAALAANSDIYADTSAAGPLTLNGAHTNAVTTITTNEAVPASWPTQGTVLIDSELVLYTGKGATSLTGCTRGTQTTFGAGAAASHNGGASVYLILTPQMYAQSAAEIVALETKVGYAGGTPTTVGNVLQVSAAGQSVWGSIVGLNVLDRVTADTSVVNTAVETNFYSKSIAGNVIGATGILRLTAWGDFLNNAGGVQNYTLKFKLGATTLLTSATFGPGASATREPWNLQLYVQNTATNAQRAFAVFTFYNAVAAGTMAGMSAAANLQGGYGTGAEDTTVAKVLACSVTLGVANPSLDFVIHGAVLEQM